LDSLAGSKEQVLAQVYLVLKTHLLNLPSSEVLRLEHLYSGTPKANRRIKPQA
jgi:hypothetical protein